MTRLGTLSDLLALSGTKNVPVRRKRKPGSLRDLAKKRGCSHATIRRKIAAKHAHRHRPADYTPEPIADALYGVFGMIGLDPCSPDPPKHIRCQGWYTVHDDGLRQPWGGLVYCNPPFEDAEAWARKCVAEHAKGVRIIAVWPNKEDVAWWDEVILPSAPVMLQMVKRIRWGAKGITDLGKTVFLLWGITEAEIEALRGALPAHHRLGEDVQLKAGIAALTANIHAHNREMAERLRKALPPHGLSVLR